MKQKKQWYGFIPQCTGVKMKKEDKTTYNRMLKRIRSGEIHQQKSWSFLEELNSFSGERLDSVALIDCQRQYTYRQFFRHRDYYAEVFSALGITGSNHARLGILGAVAVEPILAFYGANRTGASVSMIHVQDTSDLDRFIQMMNTEEITDLMVTDQMCDPDFLEAFMSRKEETSINHVILLETPCKGRFVGAAEKAYLQSQRRELRTISEVVRMKDLLITYEAYPIETTSQKSDETAVIIHTSGTTKGIHKPIPLSDAALNAAASRFFELEEFQAFEGQARTLLAMDMTAAYGMVNNLHLPLAFGGTVVCVPFGDLNPEYHRAIPYYGINILFSYGYELEYWMEQEDVDLSSVEYIVLGGSYVSGRKRKKYNAFLEQNGSAAKVAVGYGLAETGGATILTKPGCEDDSIGWPLPGVEVRIYDEADETYHTLSEGHRRGGLYIHSATNSTGRIGETVFFEPVMIEGKPYICSYDLVEVNADGSLTCSGRMNKYFINNEGVRFDAGFVEDALNRSEKIRDCVIVPSYDKLIHDTVPVLYVESSEDPADTAEVIRKALIEVFIQDDQIAHTNLPAQCRITKKLPRTTTGKVATSEITDTSLKAKRYVIKPIRENGTLTDIRLYHGQEDEFGLLYGIPEELEESYRMYFEPKDRTKKNKKLRRKRIPAMGCYPQAMQRKTENEVQEEAEEQTNILGGDLGRILGYFFSAVDTDYFYEDE